MALLTALACASADATATNQSCTLPRHSVKSEEAAVDAVMAAVDATGLLRARRLPLNCVAFITSQNQDEPRYSVSLHERHSAQCGGDPNFEPRVFTVNVTSHGRMTTDAYDIERDQPLHCPQRGASTPDDVVYDFYRWYLAQDRVSHDPIFNQRKQTAHYVSRILLRRADMNPWTGNYDYFTKSRSFDPAWINTIDPGHARVRGNEATVYLSLGVRVINAQISKVALTLKKEGGAWKIVDVRNQFWEHWDYPDHWVAKSKTSEQAEGQQQTADQPQDKADAPVDDQSSKQSNKQ